MSENCMEEKGLAPYMAQFEHFDLGGGVTRIKYIICPPEYFWKLLADAQEVEKLRAEWLTERAEVMRLRAAIEKHKNEHVCRFGKDQTILDRELWEALK